jgi:hypothetical protein
VFEIDDSDEGVARRCHFGLDGKTNDVVLTKPLPDLLTDEETLRFCIAKWEVIAMLADEGHRIESDGAHNTCALCRFYFDPSRMICTNAAGKRCPVAMATGADMCRDTPYQAFIRADKGDDYDRQVAAEREVAFLRGLLEVAIEKENC